MPVPIKVNLRGLLVRRTATALTIGGVGLVVMTFVIVWGMSAGVERVFTVSGDPANLMVMRAGSNAETTSWIPRDQFKLLEALDGIDKDPQGKPVISGELIILVNQERRSSSETANLMVRGVTPMAPSLRPNMRLVSGRMFQPGLHEAIASRGVAKRFKGCALGETLMMRKTPYKIVGTFEAPETPFDSEVWTDATDLGDTEKRPGYSSALLRVSDKIARAKVASTVKGDEQLSLEVMDQPSYFALQTQSAALIKGLGRLMTVFLAIGACFSAANTMYASVLNRSREIGTLRALGFSRTSVLFSYIVEAVVLASISGVVGLILGWMVLTFFSGHMGTSNWVTFSEVVFTLALTPGIVVTAMVVSAVIGAVGGLLPAMRAARMPIVEAIRAI
ncbi:MAG: ABC transporter permease [Acidobacteriota bacterium]